MPNPVARWAIRAASARAPMAASSRVTDTQKAGKAIMPQGLCGSAGYPAGGRRGRRPWSMATAVRPPRLNHSVTHLLHAALRQVLGEHVPQKGSLVDAERMRFDFSHFEALTTATIRRIEDLVNAQIRANHAGRHPADGHRRRQAQPVPWRCLARSTDDDVRVVRMGELLHRAVRRYSRQAHR